MPRKQEPTAVHILQYFETAPLEVAKLVLQLVTAAVHRRGLPVAIPAKKPPVASQPRKSVPAASQIVMPDPKAPPTPPAKAAPRQRKPPAPPTQPADVDLPLSGLPGPVPVVGG